MKNFMSNVSKTKRSEHLIKKSDVNETPEIKFAAIDEYLK